MRKETYLIVVLILYLQSAVGQRYSEINRDGAHHGGGEVSMHPNHQPTYKGSGGGGGGGGGGGYGGQETGTKHKDVYHPHPEKCHPQTITKYKTLYKDRKAHIKNQVEILNPRPHIKKITETRYTTIRYPVILTQVLKPVLTQIETKVKPIFKTKTINKYTTVLFTVTGIGQATITKIRYEKEYITRCLKKGGYHNKHHRRNDVELGNPYRINPSGPAYDQQNYDRTISVKPPPGIPYDAVYMGSENQPFAVPAPPKFRKPTGPDYRDIQPRNQQKKRQPLKEPVRNPSRQGVVEDENVLKFTGEIGDISELYSQNIYYKSRRSSTSEEERRDGRKLDDKDQDKEIVREKKELEPTASHASVDVRATVAHPPLDVVPAAIVVSES